MFKCQQVAGTKNKQNIKKRNKIKPNKKTFPFSPYWGFCFKTFDFGKTLVASSQSCRGSSASGLQSGVDCQASVMSHEQNPFYCSFPVHFLSWWPRLPGDEPVTRPLHSLAAIHCCSVPRGWLQLTEQVGGLRSFCPDLHKSALFYEHNLTKMKYLLYYVFKKEATQNKCFGILHLVFSFGCNFHLKLLEIADHIFLTQWWSFY